RASSSERVSVVALTHDRIERNSLRQGLPSWLILHCHGPGTELRPAPRNTRFRADQRPSAWPPSRSRTHAEERTLSSRRSHKAANLLSAEVHRRGRGWWRATNDRPRRLVAE